MPQKHLFKNGKKAKGKVKPPSRHGKVAKTKKGKLNKPPKSIADKEKWKESMQTTRTINAFNEKGVLTKATSMGDKLRLLPQPKVPKK
ncbi:hypothetical protein HOP50_07g47440 [Chloropicon primus]|uniref:Uncharacterized protein n=1 Tax=Chloropicon primus TaxID=1764295 RepID=A0A5B8MQB4_9CHLO|nr:hypothetical protein A3770_07p47220 [Chloropicon primus]UPR01422.1 hypothetical protein HOP50_07g47440 [Chloropicon primus]|mmetsp:Transcript_13584/g.38202  ORF Transcript_13584/g.38202 Transcript_13584/m.38202 type:complete len:88 (+) Transcript_13584:249-512(+)|eukprot:QDZ22204.1 hypothetical protein A3770_07p47220 [Chloropicon primus]